MKDATVIRFTTGRFDVAKERPNPINPIPGESLLLWLAEKLKGRIDVPVPQTEDWGWYVEVNWNGRWYTLGASASTEEENGQREWVLQIIKHRTFNERLLGKQRMTADDECAATLRGLLEREKAFVGVSVD